MLKFAQKFAADAQPNAAKLFTELWQAADEAGRYDLEERAAILEYEAGFSRGEAEAKATTATLTNAEYAALDVGVPIQEA